LTGENKMNVTIIGAGNMGRGIGTRAAAGGHSVTFVDANPEVAEKAAADVKSAAKNGSKISSSSLGDAQLGDVVVLAVWYGTNIAVAKQLGDKLAGKVVVDIANPLNSTYDGLATAPDSSSAEDLAKDLYRSKVDKPSIQPMPARFCREVTSAAGRIPIGDDVDAKARSLNRDRRRRRGHGSVEPRPPNRRHAVATHRHAGRARHELGQCDQDFGLKPVYHKGSQRFSLVSLRDPSW
jgi:predicted dinucleotide-binding enzyme